MVKVLTKYSPVVEKGLLLMSEYRNKQQQIDRLPPTSKSLPITLMRAREKVMEPVREMLADTGLTEQKWRVLRVLAEHDSLDGTRLAERSCLLLPSLTRILKSLEKQGYIERRRSSVDRRQHEISISQMGLDIIDSHRDRAIEIAQNIRDKLGAERHRTLLDILNTLAE